MNYLDRRQFLGSAVLGVGLLARPPAYPASSLSGPLVGVVEKTPFSGTALVARDSKIHLHRGFGLADHSFEVPCSLDTAYRIASITKLFTAVAILQLVAEGKLALEETFGRYLPDYAGPAGSRVVVRQLLNHTSGIENFDKALTSFAGAVKTGMPAYQMPHSSDELLARFASGPLVHDPGSVFDYNNADYVILGKLIEVSDGIPFDHAIRRRILDPLKLRATGLFPQRTIRKRLAPTYYSDGGGPLGNDLPSYAENWFAAGGMISTAQDLLVFAQAVFDGRLARPDLLNKMLTPGLDDYGFGLWIASLDVRGQKHRFAQRPGRIMGANTLLLHFLDDALTIILLGNTNLADTDELGFAIARQVLAS